MFTKIIGWIHVTLYFLKNTYGIYSYPNKFDKYYIILFLGLEFSRWYNKNECIISYYVKKWNNPYYCIGENPENYEDMLTVFNGNIKMYKLFEKTMTMCYIYSLLVINIRTRFFPNKIWCLFLLYYYLSTSIR
jgi:hypothetical protein